jgi:hypothetical protein
MIHKNNKIKRDFKFLEKLSYFPQVHFPPLTAPQVAKPQLLPVVHFPLQLEQVEIVFVFVAGLEETALTNATPPTIKIPTMIPMITQLFILISSILIIFYKKFLIIFSLEKLVTGQ